MSRRWVSGQQRGEEEGRVQDAPQVSGSSNWIATAAVQRQKTLEKDQAGGGAQGSS